MSYFITMLIIGILIILLGYLIGVKGKFQLIHSYHYKKVKDKDKKAYTRIMGFGTGVIGAFITIGAFLYLGFGTAGASSAILPGFILGLGIIVYAQYKYNGGIF